MEKENSDIKRFCVSPDVPVREAIKVIDATGKKVVFVVGEGDRLLGLFTDGDMRRFILRNGDLAAPVAEAMNAHPVVFAERDEAALHEEVKRSSMLVFPIVSDDGRLVRALFWDEANLVASDDFVPEEVPVIIMAGGKGSRLYPYTKILPKPLIPIGDVPISEHIIDRFRRYNCGDFYMIVNYKKNMIKAYFSDKEKEYSLNYIDEDRFLGTGGGLRLLKDTITTTFFLSNCDILIKANYGSIYRFHKAKENKITVVCAMKNVSVPYGVVTLDGEGRIAEMSEKPEFSFLTNTGLYVIEPEVIDLVKPDTFIHLPEIIQELIDRGEKVGVYPVLGTQWLDMGQFEELENMIHVLGSEDFK